jgi:hypothetical protein
MNRRDVVLAWLEAGLFFTCYSYSSWEQRFSKDAKFFLLVAERCHKYNKKASFQKSSPLLRGDKVFMKAALERDPTLLCCATQELQQDPELVTLVCASSREVVKDYIGDFTYEGKQEFLRQFHESLGNRVDLHDTLTCIIQGSILCQGVETSNNYQNMVAEYLGWGGVTTGEEIDLARKALENLT